MTHKHVGILDLVITKIHTTYTESMTDVDFLDHFIVITTLSLAKPSPACSPFETYNIKAMGMNCFCSNMLSSKVVSAPNLDVDNFIE